MRVHIIVDYSFLYYKYKFSLDKGNMKRIIVLDDSTGVNVERDISQIYYSLREIESFRRKLEHAGHDVTMTICFDMPSVRREKEVEAEKSGDIKKADGYKSNRGNKLTEKDFSDIREVQSILDKAGYNTFRLEGFEADDIVTTLVNKYKNDFDYTVIYTPDKDLLINISDKVGVYRYKWTTGYFGVDMKNYESYLEDEFKTRIPYNALGLYLSSVGDKADVIKGIHKFGNAAWSKMIDWLDSKGVNWSKCGDYNELAKVVAITKEYLKPEQFDELSFAFSMVANIDAFDIEIDSKGTTGKGHSTRESREEAYKKWELRSLYD